MRVETCCPNTIINIINFFLCLTDTSFYIYIGRHSCQLQQPVAFYPQVNSLELTSVAG